MSLFTDRDTQNKQPKPKSPRYQALLDSDLQFKRALPSAEVVQAKSQPGLHLNDVIQIVMQGYADRPALGQRARELMTDPVTGSQYLEVLPYFETITYAELWADANTLAAHWHQLCNAALAPGDFVCVLGFASIDYAKVLLASLHLGGVNVPLQTSAPVRNHVDIMAETEPHTLIAGVDYLSAAGDAVLAGARPKRLLVMDFDGRDNRHEAAVAELKKRLQNANCEIDINTLDAEILAGRELAEAPLYKPEPGQDPLTWLFYTSGSTGTPKGAMFTESLILLTWLANSEIPVITLSFTPMAHLIGNNYLFMALVNGGCSYCSPKSDLSTLFEDLSLARPTMCSLVPRVCDLFYDYFLSAMDKQLASGIEPDQAERQVKRSMRETLLGGRLLSVGCGSASLAPETHEFMESMLQEHMHIGYASTEIAGGTVMIDWKITRPPVIDYKLKDVPELGYFTTDKPHPRGELLVKSERFMAGYYKQPELTAEKIDADGFYSTGDIMAELGPDNLVYLDRCNNVQKLSQGEFVAISGLEATYTLSPLIRQIYIYGTSERAYLLAVIVPSPAFDEQMKSLGEGAVKLKLRRALSEIANAKGLNSYEVPRDFIIEMEPFGLNNGLLTEAGKHQRPKLKEKYLARFEELFNRLAEDQQAELKALRGAGSEAPIKSTLLRAVQAILGVAEGEAQADVAFVDLGGDSLSALSFSRLLNDIFQVEVPVGVILGPGTCLGDLENYIAEQKADGQRRIRCASVHSDPQSNVFAHELTLAKFIDNELLVGAAELPACSSETKTVLLTGATGYLGRFLAMDWLEKLAARDGKLLVLTRGSSEQDARQRLEQCYQSSPELLARFQVLAADYLEVVVADLALPQLGVDNSTWLRLAKDVDVIVHSGAHVNHILPYDQLFAANVVATAELIKLAITETRKRLHYISTLGVTVLCDNIKIDEASDIRQLAPLAAINSHYANGYNVSKWASEVLLSNAHEQCAISVSVFRPAMILAHRYYAGQLNVPDMFTRLLYSLVVTGIAPVTFYAEELSAAEIGSSYDGLPVDFLAAAITAISDSDSEGFHNYNLSNAEDTGVSLDTFVDWLIAAGCSITKIDSYSLWLKRFETALHALPESKRNSSLLSILSPYYQPQKPVQGHFPCKQFYSRAEALEVAVPHLDSALIAKYVADLKHLKLL